MARKTEQEAGEPARSSRTTGPLDPREIWCVGHAITDCLSEVGEDVIEELGLARGAMTLIDSAAIDALEARLAGYTTISGGSAANTAVGAAAAGARVGFVGSVADDRLGVAYRSDLERAGVACRLSVVSGGQSEPGPSGRGSQNSVTGRCYVLVSADGERTMATHLGVAGAIDPGAIDHEEIARSKVVYLEGYLLDAAAGGGAVAAILDAVAASPTTTLALSLSDPFVVTRHRDRIAALVADSVGLLFANEAELCELTGCSRLGDALSAVRHPGLVAAITRGAEGVVIAQGSAQGSARRLEVGEVPALPVERVVDTTGAGDLFAAGMLAGLVSGLDPLESARLGTEAAAEVISHLGARPAPPR